MYNNHLIFQVKLQSYCKKKKTAWKWHKMYLLINRTELRSYIQAHPPIAHHSWQSGQQYTLGKKTASSAMVLVKQDDHMNKNKTRSLSLTLQKTHLQIDKGPQHKTCCPGYHTAIVILFLIIPYRSVSWATVNWPCAKLEVPYWASKK